MPASEHSKRKADGFGLPGKLSDVALKLPDGLSYDQVRDGLRLIGRTGRALGWWAADLLVYAETRFGEAKFSQLAEELGYAPHTLQNLLTVGHAWPSKRRRAGLEIGHHAVLSRLEVDDQEHWAGLALAGDTLPNQETKRWSVTRLREELRALTPAKPEAPPTTAAAKTAGKGTTAGSAPAAASGSPDRKAPITRPILVKGGLVEFSHLPGIFRVETITRRPGEILVTLVEV